MRRMLKRIALIGTVILVLLIVYGTFVEPFWLDIENHEASIPGLPSEWDGQRVGVIGDFQVGMWMDNQSTIRRAVDDFVREKPAAVLIPGDFIYHGKDDGRANALSAAILLEPLRDAGIPTFAVLGNHDYGVVGSDAAVNEERAKQVAEALEAVGVRLLRNEAVTLDSVAGGTPLHLVGIDSHAADKARPETALAGLPAGAPRIIMHHHPDTFEKLPANSAPLAVAGHTHGGQIAFPFLPQRTWLTYRQSGEVHADGWISDSYGAEGNRLYVNRGIGFSRVPIRIGSRPEVTYFTLRTAN